MIRSQPMHASRLAATNVATIKARPAETIDLATTIFSLNGRAHAAHSVADAQAAQEFMSLHPDWTVLHIQPNGITVLSHADDVGFLEP